MRPLEAARQAKISSDTLKRWLKDYAEFFTPSATPIIGRSRDLKPHDQRVILFIAALRNAGVSHKDIQTRLEEARAGDYADLPPLPVQEVGSIPSDVAAARAQELIENALLQKELALAREKVQELEATLSSVEEAGKEKDARLQSLELELATARGELAALQARLEGYAFGGSRPIAPALLIMAALAAGAVLLMVFYALISLLG